jgi:hypothetical protein
MAGINKMYWTNKEHRQFWDWFCNYYKIDVQGRDMLTSITIYDPESMHDHIVAVTHFSGRVDKYLKKHCPLKFVQQRLDEQYGGKLNG